MKIKTEIIEKLKIKRRGKDSVLFTKTRGEKIVYSIVFIIFSFYAVSMLVPFVWMFINACKDGTEYAV